MKQTPEEMAAAFAAFAEAHNAARLDLLAYERGEAGRLVDLCRANYSTPGGPWHYVGESVEGKRQLCGLGSFEHQPGVEMPGQIHAVYRLCTCLYGIQNGVEEVDRLRDAKHLSLLLERAQRACGMNTLADTAAGLSERQKEILLSLLAQRAFHADEGVNTPLIKNRMPDGADEGHVGELIREFIKAGILCSNGKQKKHRLCWLSIMGRAIGEHLRYIYGTPE